MSVNRRLEYINNEFETLEQKLDCAKRLIESAMIDYDHEEDINTYFSLTVARETYKILSRNK